MVEKRQKPPSSDSILRATSTSPRSLPIAKKGITTDRDFSALMSAIMSDLIEGTVTPSVGNATVNAGGKLLKVVEMRLKYGTQHGDEEKLLRLTSAAA
jgi:hypothetical protein